MLKIFEKNKENNIFQEIFEYSPAEISIIEMAPGNDRFTIVDLNKLKAKEFNIDNVSDVRGKKCYSIFEPEREGKLTCELHCNGCPALDAYNHEGKIIHRDWPYYNSCKNENKFVSLTAQRIPGTTKVVEICRDSTIRKVISDSISELERVTNKQKIDEIIFSVFLEKLYFERCRIYEYSESEGRFIPRKFRIVKNRIKGQRIEYEDLDINEIDFENNLPEENFRNASTDAVPIIYFINKHFGTFSKNHYFGLNEGQYFDNHIFNKKDYPIWLEIPIISTNKIIGKICIDKKINEIPDIGIEDYDIEIIGLFAQNIGNVVEKLLFLDITKLHEINEIVLRNNKNNIDDNLAKILLNGCKYLGFLDGKIIIDMDSNLKIIELNAGTLMQPYNLPYNSSIYNEVLSRKENSEQNNAFVYDLNLNPHIKKYQDVNHHKEINFCLLNTILDENCDSLGVWYLESQKPFNEEVLSRIKMLADQTAIAVTSIKQYLELENEKNLANHFRIKAEEALKEREMFIKAAEHEMMAPVDPIMHRLEFIKLKVGENADEKLKLAIEDALGHCNFLNYTFYNINLLLTDDLRLDKVPISIFNKIIIPIIESLKDYAHSLNVGIIYSGHLIVEKTMLLDEMRMKNVFFNLIRNAIKYSTPGTTVYVKGVKVIDNYSFIEIENTGIGIPDGEEKTIFELYKRCDNAKEANPSGMGIGLSIVEQIICKHNGKIKVKQNNNPTIFQLSLPKE